MGNEVAFNQPVMLPVLNLREFSQGKVKKKKKKDTKKPTTTHTHKINKTTVFLAPPNQMADGMEPIKHRFKRLFI